MTKLKHPNSEKLLKKNSFIDKVKKNLTEKTKKKPKLWQNLRTQTVIKLKKKKL